MCVIISNAMRSMFINIATIDCVKFYLYDLGGGTQYIWDTVCPAVKGLFLRVCGKSPCKGVFFEIPVNLSL